MYLFLKQDMKHFSPGGKTIEPMRCLQNVPGCNKIFWNGVYFSLCKYDVVWKEGT